MTLRSTAWHSSFAPRTSKVRNMSRRRVPGCRPLRKDSVLWVYPTKNGLNANFRFMTHCTNLSERKNVRVMPRTISDGAFRARPHSLAAILFGLVCLISPSLVASQSTTTKATDDWKGVEVAIGRPGEMQPGDVMKFAMPRKDLQVTLRGVAIKPGLALGSWVAFRRDGAEGMVMGDLVLTEDEVEPVMLQLQKGGRSE